jgi:mRNA interferase MazF
VYNTVQLTNHRPTTYNYNNNINISYKRGDIVYVDFSKVLKEDFNCSIQQKIRPVLIIQNDTGNKYSPTILVAIITSKNKKSNMPTHVRINKEVGLNYDSTVTVEQQFTIDKKMILSYICKCPDYIMEQIDTAMKIQNGIMDIDYVNQLIDSIKEIEEYAFKYGFDIEDMRMHASAIKELKSYCNQYNYDYNKLLKERLFVKISEEQYKNII